MAERTCTERRRPLVILALGLALLSSCSGGAASGGEQAAAPTPAPGQTSAVPGSTTAVAMAPASAGAQPGVTPSISATQTLPPTPPATATAEPSATAEPPATATAAPTATPLPTATVPPSPAPLPAATATQTPAPAPEPTATPRSAPRSTPVAPPAGGKEAFIRQLAPWAQAEQADSGVPAAFTIALAASETGWGVSPLMRSANNYLGLTCSAPNEGLPCVPYGGALWNAYTTPQDAFIWHGRWLRAHSQFAPAFEHTNDLAAFVHDIWTCYISCGIPFPQGQYDGTMALIKQYNLEQYDNKP
jgi:flagellum-specific peptidoglycan hydrolase FlgJ